MPRGIGTYGSKKGRPSKVKSVGGRAKTQTEAKKSIAKKSIAKTLNKSRSNLKANVKAIGSSVKKGAKTTASGLKKVATLSGRGLIKSVKKLKKKK